jgi:uncharacterized protein
MTTATAPHRTGRLLPAPVPFDRARDRASRAFTVATAVGVAHALDDAVIHRQPGVPLGQHLPALLVVTAAAVAAAWLFRRAGTGVRAGLALVVGGAMLANGALHVMHVSADRLSGSDATGVVAAAGGLTLLAMAAALPFVHRGERGLSPRRRWAVRGLATVTTVLLAIYWVVPIALGIAQTHLFREPVGAAPRGYEAVTFEASDGLELSGWYARSRNKAAVLIANTSGGDRLGSVQQADMLAAHGYGVLLYDARGSGESEGTPNGYGWDWTNDVSGAVDYLRRRPDVDPDRIGGLGLSTGANVMIEAAADNRNLKAVVADGATAGSLADLSTAELLANAYIVPAMGAVQLFSGTAPGEPMVDLAARVSPTPLLLIAAGSLRGEIESNEKYAAAAKEPVDLWTLPDAHHTAAIREVREQYERRVLGHFDRALLGSTDR